MKLKSRMTVGEMSEHLTEHTGKFANRVSVGRYAKKLGYAVYKTDDKRQDMPVLCQSVD